MKTKILLLIAINIFFLSNVIIKEAFASSEPTSKDSMNIFCSPDIYNLASCWAREYCIINPNLQIKVVRATDLQTSSNLFADRNLNFISNEYYLNLHNESIWEMVVGRDIIVPIINSRNPFLKEINQRGVSPEKMNQSLTNPENQNWGTLIVNGQKNPVTYFTIKNANIKSNLCNFLKLDQNMMKENDFASSEEMIAAIQKDPYAIGFCKISSILDANNQSIIEGIRLLPIDNNNNGKIDFTERNYDDLSTFLRAVWIGKYPKALCKNIYLVSKTKPTNESQIEFLTWVLSNGQQFLNANGYSDLVYSQRESNLVKLKNQEIISKVPGNSNIVAISILILIAIIVIFFSSVSIIQRLIHAKELPSETSEIPSTFFNENLVEIPEGLFFDKFHTWTFMKKNGLVEIGIDDFLLHVTGPITRIKMKNQGEKIKKGDPFISIIQEGKQLNINAPISGIVKELNKNLNTNTSLINSAPYSEGWIYMIEPSNWLREIQFLSMSETYKVWLKMEFSRLKDFLAIALKLGNQDNAQIILQDGGEIKNGILEDLNPKIWEDFQTYFLNNPK